MKPEAKLEQASIANKWQCRPACSVMYTIDHVHGKKFNSKMHTVLGKFNMILEVGYRNCPNLSVTAGITTIETG
jgi:hypothetical protein